MYAKIKPVLAAATDRVLQRSSDDKVLLLQRTSKHNDGKWGLPGGNAEKVDSDFQATAEREATEELGALPNFQIAGSLLTKCASWPRVTLY